METLELYLTRLAGPSATPGGGSAAMFVAASGAALLAMVCRISMANPKFTEKREAAERIVAAADALRAEFMAAAKRDEDAYESVVHAQRLPKSSETEKTSRASALEGALHEAATVPLQMAARALHALELANRALAIENKNLISDVGCAAEFSHAAIKACAYSVRINHRYMKDTTAKTSQAEKLAHIELACEQLITGLRAAVNASLGV